MAGSRYEYVKRFELPDPLLPSTFFVVRLDGKGFHGFSTKHGFAKPNDRDALALMNDAAARVMRGRELNGECVMAFGESDEYRFVWFPVYKRDFGRCRSLMTTLPQFRVQVDVSIARPTEKVRPSSLSDLAKHDP